MTLFHLCSVIDGFCWFCMRLLCNNIQLMLVFLNAPWLIVHFAHYALMTPLMLCAISIYADNTMFCSKCKQVSDLWKELELLSELEFDLRDTVDRGLLISMLEKINPFCLTCLKQWWVLTWKSVGLLLRKNNLFIV